jgi:uncharacterized protein (TIRG00374 family)
MNRKSAGIVLFAAFLVILVIFLIPRFDINSSVESIKNASISLLILAFLAVLIGNICGALRWSLILKSVNAKNSRVFINALGVYCLGQVAGLFVPSRIGTYSKAPLINKMDNIPYETGLSAVNAETLMDLVYLSCAGILSALILSVFFSSHPYVYLIVAILMVVTFAGILVVHSRLDYMQSSYQKLIEVSSDTSRSWLVRKPAYALSKIFDLIRSTRDIFTDRLIIVELSAWTIFTQIFGVLGLFFVIESVHTSLPLLHIFAILTISYLVGIASLIPGGWGASDLSLIVLLGSEGVAIPVATDIAILWRLAMYLPVLMLIGVFFLQKKVSGTLQTVIS